MLKAKCKVNGIDTLFFGFTCETMGELINDQYVEIKREHMKIDNTIVFLYADTLPDLARLLDVEFIELEGDMVKIKYESNGLTTLFLGLTANCIRHLKTQKPIMIKNGELEIDHDIYILYGNTIPEIIKTFDLPALH